MSQQQANLDFGVPLREQVNEARLRELRSFAPADARREAHDAAMRSKQRMYAQILAWAKRRRDFIVDELIAEWNCSPNHVAPRCTEMLQMGKLVSTGKRRKTRMGRGAAVLRAA